MELRRTAAPARMSPWRAFEAAMILTALALVVSLGLRVVAGLAEAQAWWLLPLGVLGGLLSADFASGTVHWFCDHFFEEDTPLLGRSLIGPFRAHHRDPQAMVHHGALELHGNSCIPVVVLLLFGLLLPSERSGLAALGIHLWILCFAATSMVTNQFHKWAHAPSVPPAVQWLQQRGLILSPERHARHHSGDFSSSYCMTCGWMNPPLDRLDFFPRVERAIRHVWQGRA